MYLQSQTWLAGPSLVAPPPAAPKRAGLRGLGSTWSFAVNPGDSCYDPSHSPGQAHYRLWFPGMSPAETTCLSGTAVLAVTDPSQLAPGLPVGYDPTTGLIDPSNVNADTVPTNYAAAFSALVPPASLTAENPSGLPSWVLPVAVAVVGILVAVAVGKR